jgi:hypothetical protein
MAVEKLVAVVGAAHRDLADVGAGEQRPPDVDRVRRRRHEGGVAGPSSTHIRWLKPSLAPMVLMTSVSGSRLTPKRRR